MVGSIGVCDDGQQSSDQSVLSCGEVLITGLRVYRTYLQLASPFWAEVLASPRVDVCQDELVLGPPPGLPVRGMSEPSQQQSDITLTTNNEFDN